MKKKIVKIPSEKYAPNYQSTEEEQADQLSVANKELAYQISEKIKRAAELIIANEELLFQNSEKEKRAAELIIANEELLFQNSEKEKRAAELIIANEELLFQNSEKEKRASELIVANKELLFQNSEKEKRAGELIIANEELVFQNSEKEKRAAELHAVNKSLKKIKEHQKRYIIGLEEMMFMTSHAVRSPVVNILGIATQLEACILPDGCEELIDGMKTSACALDVFTQELTTKINVLKEKKKR
ncbi:diguanylate cyclase [Flavobacterium sp. SM2513]|uniref:diguanylate cyclase n=1 Tax=Flavobacterium sp. SM2513 TaxID=3424766 RepID=UPI003D7F9B06